MVADVVPTVRTAERTASKVVVLVDGLISREWVLLCVPCSNYETSYDDIKCILVAGQWEPRSVAQLVFNLPRSQIPQAREASQNDYRLLQGLSLQANHSGR